MPRYFLHVYNGTGFAEDEEGREFPNAEAASGEAVAGARSLLSAELLTGQIDLRGRIEVTDESGTIVDLVPFSRVVRILEGEPPGGGSGAAQ